MWPPRWYWMQGSRQPFGRWCRQPLRYCWALAAACSRHRRPSAHQLFDSISVAFEGTVDCQMLATAFGNPQADLVRAKGLMTDRDGTARALQLVGTRCTVVPSSHPHPESGRLVCIALKGRLNPPWVMQVLTDAGASNARATNAGIAA